MIDTKPQSWSGSLLLVAMTSMLAANLVSPATTQESPSVEVETSRHDILLPLIMGAPTELQAYDGPDGSVRVLNYPTEPIPATVSIFDGRVSGVRLDIARIDERGLPAYSRAVWLGMDRTTVLRILGVPAADQLHDRFDMKVEHMVFEHPGHPDVSIFFIGGRVVNKKVGRDLPSGILGFALPVPHKATNEETDALWAARSKRQIAIGMTIDEIQELFGPPKHLVDYTFKGRPANYRIYQTDEDGSFGSFTFVDEILVEFAGGGRTPLSQVLDGH